MNCHQAAIALMEAGLLVFAPDLDIEFRHISYNSNDVIDKTLFLVKGEHFRDEYLIDAIAKGACCYVAVEARSVDIPGIIVNDIRKAQAVLAGEFYQDRDIDLKRIAVTGSKGKTTTVLFINNILSAAFDNPVAYTSTIGFFDGKKTGKQFNNNTTMEPIDAYRTISAAAENGAKYMVMEISSQAAKVDRIYGMRFDIGIFTNIGLDHLSENEHKDFDEYLNAKISIMAQCDTVFLYREIDHYQRIRDSLPNARIYTYGVNPDSDFVLSDIRLDDGKYLFNVHGLRGDGEIFDSQYSIGIFGEFNILNALAAICVCQSQSIPEHAIREGLESTQVPGRCIVVKTFKCPVIVDYAHNGMSAQALFESIQKAFPGKRLTVVFGCPGGRGVNRRAELGEICGQYASQVFLTTDDPGYESFEDITSQIVSHIPESTSFEVIEDREEAIKEAMRRASCDDVIALIGKGHETTQVIDGVYYFYKSDLKVVEENLQLV